MTSKFFTGHLLVFTIGLILFGLSFFSTLNDYLQLVKYNEGAEFLGTFFNLQSNFVNESYLLFFRVTLMYYVVTGIILVYYYLKLSPVFLDYLLRVSWGFVGISVVDLIFANSNPVTWIDPEILTQHVFLIAKMIVVVVFWSWFLKNPKIKELFN